jgi:DNA-binding NarL/FixJ family response regulator
MTLRILIADDHPVIRQGIQRLLGSAYPEAEFRGAANGSEVIDLVRAEPWSLLLLDIHMPGRGGLSALTELCRLRPKLPILVLTMYPEEHYAMRVLAAGAAGYLRKEAAGRELVAAVRKILAGGRYISEDVAEQVVNAVTGDREARLIASLTNREFQALRLFGLGRSHQEIADALGVSYKTAQYYRSRLLNKLGLHRTADLILFCERHGVLR